MRLAIFGLLALTLAPACTMTTAGTCGCVTPAQHVHHVHVVEEPRPVHHVHHAERPPHHAAAPNKSTRPKRPRVARAEVSPGGIKADRPRPAAEQPEPRPGIRPEPRPSTRPSTRPVVQPEPRPVVQPEPRPVVQPEPRPVVQPEPRPSTRPEPRPTTPITDLPLRRSPERHPKPDLPPKHNEPVLSR